MKSTILKRENQGIKYDLNYNALIGAKMLYNKKLPIIGIVSFFLLWVTLASAVENGRYIRVENPKSDRMVYSSIQVYSNGVNIVAKHPEMFRGIEEIAKPAKKGPSKISRYLTGETINPESRGEVWYSAVDPNTGKWLNYPWFEIDLGKEMPIEQIVIGASQWSKSSNDTSVRVVSLLSEDRKVTWAKNWRYKGKNSSPDGIFKFEVAPLENDDKMIAGIFVPETCYGWAPMTWLFKLDPSPVHEDDVERMQRFNDRNSPENLKKFADEFFVLLDRKIPELRQAMTYYDGGQYQKAFDAWKTVWFVKIKQEFRNMALNQAIPPDPSSADDLLAGKLFCFGPNYAHYFTPGKICWVPLSLGSKDNVNQTYLLEGQPTNWKTAVAIAQHNVALNTSHWSPLITIYAKTGQKKYLERWCEIQDDWAMNYFRDAAKFPWEVENMFTFSPGLSWLQFMEDLHSYAKEQPKIIEDLNSITLARIQLTCMDKYITSWQRQSRSTAFNHNAGGLNAYYAITRYISEFLPGQQAAREWQQAFERWMTTLGTERDGSNTEIGDEGHMEYSFPLSPILGDLDKTKPEWYTAGWKNQSLHWLDGLYYHLIRHLSPGGFDHRDGVALRTMRFLRTDFYNTDRQHLVMLNRDKEVFGQPEVRRILAEWGQIAQSDNLAVIPNFKAVSDMVQEKHRAIKETHFSNNPTYPGKPVVLSAYTPYTGEYYFRGGQNSDAAFLSMAAYGSFGGSHGGLRVEEMYYGAFWSYNFGFPMLRSSAIKINGAPPQQFYGRWQCYLPGSKTTELCESEEKPAQHRWLSTTDFDFGEAKFKGAFQHFGGPKGEVMMENPPTATNVDSWRQIIQIRDLNVFLTCDTVAIPDNNDRTISVMYEIPLIKLNKKNSIEFDPQKQLITNSTSVDEVSSIKTFNPEAPSLSFYQVANNPLNYAIKNKPAFSGEFRARLGDEIAVAKQQVELNFAKTHELQYVSLMVPRNTGASEAIQEIKPHKAQGVIGLYAKFVNGTELWFQSAGKAVKTLTCDNLTAQASMLMVIKHKNNIKGLVLDGEAISQGAKVHKIPNQNGQFGLVDNTIVTTPILTPIDPIRYLPDCRVFNESQTVEMVTDTKNVEIRYTTDGTLPTRTSRLYTGKLKISETTEFAARAYRLDALGKAMEADDFEINGTKFTIPSFGFFNKKPLQPALNIENSKLKQGLLRELVEAQWWTLFNRLHWLPAVKSVPVQRELDMDDVKLNESYGLRYKGYINVPHDGVYTFHAPEEFYKHDYASSYDLRIYIDGQELYLTQWWHARGTWSVPLKKGHHKFEVDFGDARTTPWRKSGCWRDFPSAWSLYKGNPTPIKVSGPGLSKPDRIPEEWLFRDE